MITADELRQAALSLPEAVERETWGHPTFRVRNKMFAAPETFGVPAYVGRHGWVSIQLATADPAEVRELLTEAWRQTAPKRLVASFDATAVGGRGSMPAWLPDPARFR